MYAFKGYGGQLSRVLHADHSQEPAMGQYCTDGHGSGRQPWGKELQFFLWNFLTLILTLLEEKKKVYQQRAAVACSHQVLPSKSLRDSVGTHAAVTWFREEWKMPQLRGDRKCWAKGMCVWLQRNALLSDKGEIWQSCLIRNLSWWLKLKKMNLGSMA